MARNIPTWLSGIVEKLELNRPDVITSKELEGICSELGISTPVRVIASKLKNLGWLLPTSQRGVWEFVPAETAGVISSFDPMLSVKAFQAANPKTGCALTMQSAAWAYGLADRIPAKKELVFPTIPKLKIPSDIKPLAYAWKLEPREQRGVKALAPESIIVHMAQRPNAVRSWQSATEWLPDIAYEVDKNDLITELQGRSPSTWARTGYLLQGMRPDISEEIARRFTPSSKIRFGRSEKARRNDEQWKIIDYALPEDPKEMRAVM